MMRPEFHDAEPMPSKGGFRESKYQWLEDLEVGQSFDVATDGDYRRVAASSAMLEKKGYLPEGFKLARRKIGSVIRAYRTA
mgnify:CR=1 FL=1